jgi:N-glycosylase/DNA lyase
MKKLKEIYKFKKAEIESRLKIFKKNGLSDNKKIFSELCFCILTPQSKAVVCDAAIKKLVETKTLFSGNKSQISRMLTGVRFHNNKARYIEEARKVFTDKGRINMKKNLMETDLFILRDFLVKTVKGYGLKEASHFLRNIGRGSDIAILDRHILSEMKKYGIINTIPASITRKTYLQMEQKLRIFSKKTKIPMDALDLLFWFNKTGYFFK